MRNIQEAYAAVYNNNLIDDNSLFCEDLSFVDQLSDDELCVVMENLFLNGSVEIFECFDSLDYMLTEATVTYGHETQRRMDKTAERQQKVRVGRMKQAAGKAVENIKSGAKKTASSLGGKLRSAGEKIGKFLGRVGRAAKAGWNAAKSEYKGGSSSQSSGSGSSRVTTGASDSDASDDDEDESPKAPQGKYRGSGSGQREKAGGTVATPKPTKRDPNSLRFQQAKAKLAKAASGKTARGVRFAGPQGEVASQRSNTGRKEALGKFRKKIGLSDHYQYLLDAIFEDMINEGYVNDYETALYVVESLSESDLDYILESYDLYLTEEVETLDLYDVVLEHLLDEGYADSEEAATVIMANMSEEWREEIIGEELTGPRRSAAEKKIIELRKDPKDRQKLATLSNLTYNTGLGGKNTNSKSGKREKIDAYNAMRY
jgi:hypothetical protein